MLRIILSALNVIISIMIFLCGECFVVSLSTTALPENIYRLVDIIRLNFWGFSFPIYKCDIGGLLSVIRNHTQEIFFKLGLLYLIPLIASLMFFYAMYSLIPKIIVAKANKKTTLHGSSRWMTEKEMQKMGLLNKAGLILGQTRKAEFREEKAEKPKRKPGELESDYQTRLNLWSPEDKVTTGMEEPGDMIAQNGNNHTLIVGSTRSGKGVSVIIPTQFEWNESMILLDPKSEGWQISSNFRSKFSYTFKFEPERPKESIHYNPLLAIRRGRQTVADIQNLSLILIPYNENAKDPFWDNEARKLLSAVIGYVIYCEKPENKTFKQVYSIFTTSLKKEEKDPDDWDDDDDDPNESAIKKYLKQYAKNASLYNEEMPEMPPALEARFNDRYKLDKKSREELEKETMAYLTADDKANISRFEQDLTYFANCEDRQLSSVVSTMMSNLQVIADPNVQDVTDRSDFVMEDFVQGIIDENGVRHPLSLYMCVSMASMKRLMPLIRMMYEQAITLLTRELKKNPYRLLLIFDEFYQMGRMEVVEKALALSAGYGILCAVVIQSYDQLQKLYQSEATFTDNFAYQVILRVNEQKTCEKISAMLGKETKRQRKVGTSGSVYSIAGNNASVNVEQVGRELMTAEEVRTMGENDCLIFSSGNHPYKAKKIRYYLDDRFRRLYIGKDGKVMPTPDDPKSLEENQPHPEAVDKNGKRVGLDNEGWQFVLGYDSRPEFIVTDDNGVKADIELMEEEALDPFNVEAKNEIDVEMSVEEIKELLGIQKYSEESYDSSVVELLNQYDQMKKEMNKAV